MVDFQTQKDELSKFANRSSNSLKTAFGLSCHWFTRQITDTAVFWKKENDHFLFFNNGNAIMSTVDFKTVTLNPNETQYKPFTQAVLESINAVNTETEQSTMNLLLPDQQTLVYHALASPNQFSLTPAFLSLLKKEKNNTLPVSALTWKQAAIQPLPVSFLSAQQSAYSEKKLFDILSSRLSLTNSRSPEYVEKSKKDNNFQLYHTLNQALDCLAMGKALQETKPSVGNYLCQYSLSLYQQQSKTRVLDSSEKETTPETKTLKKLPKITDNDLFMLHRKYFGLETVIVTSDQTSLQNLRTILETTQKAIAIILPFTGKKATYQSMLTWSYLQPSRGRWTFMFRCRRYFRKY